MEILRSGNISTFTSEELYKAFHDSNYYYSEGGLYDVPFSVTILLSFLYGGISIAALIGNALVLWVVAISPRMRTVTNMFIANLALADIIIGLFAMPFQFQAALLQRWYLPEFMCAFCPFVQVLCVNVSAFTLSAIAMDRYRAVIFPLDVRDSTKKASLIILSIWLVGLILAFPTKLDYKIIYINGEVNGMRDSKISKLKPFCTNLGLTDTFRTYYTLGIVIIQYFFPLIIITGAYASITKKLWGASVPGNREECRDAVLLKNKKKVIKMLTVVVLLFAVCWLPLQTYNFLQTLIPSINEFQYINIIWFSCHLLAMSNSFCNPFIYAIYNDKFQREFRARLKCTFFRRSSSGDQNNLHLEYSSCNPENRYKVQATPAFSRNSNTSGILLGDGREAATRLSSPSISNNTTSFLIVQAERRSNFCEFINTKKRFNGQHLSPAHAHFQYPSTKRNLSLNRSEEFIHDV